MTEPTSRPEAKPDPILTTQLEALGSRIAASLGEYLGIPYEDGKKRFTALLQAEAERTSSSAPQDRSALLADLDRAQADAKSWHDTYQQDAGAVDEFFTVLLRMLPGAADEGMDAYDQIPRGIEKLTAERDQLRTEQATVFAVLKEALGTEPATLGQATKQAIKVLTDVRAERELLREFVAAAPCDPHPGNGYCQTHGQSAPCPHAAAKELLGLDGTEAGT